MAAVEESRTGFTWARAHTGTWHAWRPRASPECHRLALCSGRNQLAEGAVGSPAPPSEGRVCRRCLKLQEVARGWPSGRCRCGGCDAAASAPQSDAGDQSPRRRGGDNPWVMFRCPTHLPQAHARPGDYITVRPQGQTILSVSHHVPEHAELGVANALRHMEVVAVSAGADPHQLRREAMRRLVGDALRGGTSVQA